MNFRRETRLLRYEKDKWKKNKEYIEERRDRIRKIIKQNEKQIIMEKKRWI